MKVWLKVYVFLFISFAFMFANQLSLKVLSYIGKLEYATIEFGPWKSLDVDDTIPEKGFLRLSSTSDSAELLRSDGVVIRLIGNTTVSIQSLFQAQKPKQGVAGLFRKKPPLIEIRNEVAVAAVRGSMQGTLSLSVETNAKPKSSPLAGFFVGTGGLFSHERSGILIKSGYLAETWQMVLLVPILWNTNEIINTQWKTLDGWLALLDTLTIGKETEFFFFHYGEKELSLGEGFLFERNIRHYHRSRFSENILLAQINFGDVGVRGFVDRPTDPDLWAIEAFIKPFWGTEGSMESLVIKGFVLNEKDARSTFFPGEFQTTNGEIAYLTGYGFSTRVPVINVKTWTVALFGEISGLNEKTGIMGGLSFAYPRIASLDISIGRGEDGYIPWYFDSTSRYLRPFSTTRIDQATNKTMAWSIGGTVGPEDFIRGTWALKHYAEQWKFQTGIHTGTKLSSVSVYAGTQTTWNEMSSAFRPENTLSLVRLIFATSKVSLSTEYAQALNEWENGTISLMAEVKF
ncbi:MAG: hypothetical protein ACK4HQ_00615 [Brevinematales bacterium]